MNWTVSRAESDVKSCHFCLFKSRSSKYKWTDKESFEYTYHFRKCADAVYQKLSKSVHACGTYRLPKLAHFLRNGVVMRMCLLIHSYHCAYMMSLFRHCTCAFSVAITQCVDADQTSITLFFQHYTGWAKRPDCFWDETTLQWLTIERRVIRQKVQNFV